MKDALVNLLVFLLIFVVVATIFLANYWISLALVPGGKGLVFSNPYAGALFPSLLAALFVAQYRAVHKPGHFRMTWLLLAAGFFLLLTLSIPVIQQAPPVRASDASPLVPDRFLTLDDGSLVLSTPPATVLIPNSVSAMAVSTGTQYDSLNQRFVFPSEPPRSLGSTGPEQAYFQYTPALVALQKDFLATYSVLRGSVERNPLAFWAQAGAVTWLFMGMYFFFSFRTWPLVRVVLVLLVYRLALVFLVYAFWTVPALVDLWTPADFASWLRIWLPIFLILVASACLFFMSWVTKPHRQEALT